MNVFLLGAAVVALTVVLHVLTWRLRLVRRTVGRLVALYVVALVACGGLGACGVLPAPGSAAGAVRAVLMSVAVFLVYLSFYTAVEKDSASSVILLAAARPGGASRATLYGVLHDEDMIVERLRGLVRTGFVRVETGVGGHSSPIETGRLRLTARGRLFVGLLRAARRPFTSERFGG